MDDETMKRIVLHIKNASIFYDTPMVVEAHHTIRDAM
jgi:hypothetical protein